MSEVGTGGAGGRGVLDVARARLAGCPTSTGRVDDVMSSDAMTSMLGLEVVVQDDICGGERSEVDDVGKTSVNALFAEALRA